MLLLAVGLQIFYWLIIYLGMWITNVPYWQWGVDVFMS